MNEQQAIALVQKTFKSAFDRSGYIHFLKNLLNEFDDEGARSNQGARISEKFQNHVQRMERVGKYTVDEQEVMLFIVYLKNNTSIERARTMQRNFVASYLQKDMKDAALVAFVSNDPANWRFSFIKMEYRYDEENNKIREEFTPAKRWSFLVGTNEASHTAQRQFKEILQDDVNNPTLEQLEAAFNIEKVTNDFFKEYRRLFIETKEALDKAVEAEPVTQSDFEAKGVDTVNLAKKLLGQIIFLYYLQKKGWFGVARDAAWGEGSRNFLRELFDKKHGEYKNFFNDILEPLFYDALRRDRSEDDHYYPKFNCKIPFLNGGLFDPMNNYDWVKTDILLPNELFHNKTKTKEGDEGDGILDIFDRYNFTVKEDEPFEKEVAIDPELLGKAYEKFNAIRPDNYDEFLKALKSGKKGDESKFNKQYGVYYTPREIVHYMCQQSLINYLSTENSEKGLENSYPTKDDFATLILKGEQIKEHDERVAAEGRETATYSFQMPESIRNHAALIDEKLANIKVCDPAVGSGAFPVGMMSEVVRAREVLKTWMKTKKTMYKFKRECIENSLYGVDIDSGAVEIAKLRLWLSLVVDEDDIQNIKPLPNLDYKIVCGNSLLGVEKNLFNLNLFSELETLKPLYFNATNITKKKETKTKIDGLIDQITDGRAQFDFEIYFSEVFHEKGGFDVVMGNPPYVGERGNKSFFREIAQSIKGKKYYHRKMDLFYFFFHLALDMSKNNGCTAFITTNYFVTADGAKGLRADFKARSSILKLINFNEVNIFDSAPGQHNMITIFKKTRNDDVVCESCVTRRSGWADSTALQNIMNGNDDETDYWLVSQSNLFEGENSYIRPSGNNKDSSDPIQTVLQKLQSDSQPLGIICKVNQGILTGVDKVKDSHVHDFPKSQFQKGDGVYVLSAKERLDLKDNSNIFKPWFKNSDIHKYFTNNAPEEYVIYATRDLDINKTSTLYRHFLKFETAIKARNQDRGEMQAAMKLGKWWVIFAARKNVDFEGQKIVAPQRSYINTFGFNETSWYASADVYYITRKQKNISLKYILALLNSKLYYIWLYHRGKRKGQMLELYQKPLSEIPIKKISDDEQKPFIKLVDRILAAKAKNPQADTNKLEEEIDELVYQLYGLTEEEKNIVKGK